jgi:hypothetical protein
VPACRRTVVTAHRRAVVLSCAIVPFMLARGGAVAVSRSGGVALVRYRAVVMSRSRTVSGDRRKGGAGGRRRVTGHEGADGEVG